MSQSVSAVELKGKSLTQRSIERFKRHRMALLSFYVIMAYVGVAVLYPLLPFARPEEQILEHANLGPSFYTVGQRVYRQKEKELLEVHSRSIGRKVTVQELPTPDRHILMELEEHIATAQQEIRLGEVTNPYHKRYWLGTDQLGRDLLSRIVQGGRVSIFIGIVCALVSILLGTFIGSIAAYLGGTFDYLMMRVVDVLYGLPYILLYVIFMALFGKSIVIIFLAISLTSWLTVSRVTRGQVISLKNYEFIQAAITMGASHARILLKHILPNIVSVVVVFTALQIPNFILAESVLSFLGLGISAPMASWGTLISEGVPGMILYPWRLLIPSVVMIIFLVALSFVGDGLRDAFDPKSQR